MIYMMAIVSGLSMFLEIGMLIQLVDMFNNPYEYDQFAGMIFFPIAFLGPFALWFPLYLIIQATT